MVADTVSGLVEALLQTGILEPEQREELPRLTPRFRDARALARELVQRGWLTPFQANRLVQNRGHELVLGSYVLLELIAEGGMGQVYKAKHARFGRVVALKVIHKDKLKKKGVVDRFERERRTAALLDHPNIVHAYDADDVGDTRCLVMEFVDGQSLTNLVTKHGPMPVTEAADCIRQAALGLQHAHERRMVHRDIKPSNLLRTTVTVDGRERTLVKILDMGLARITEEEQDAALTQLGTVLGTPDFIAPEQARNTRLADVRSDIYSLGCTFYFLLTGKPPFPEGTVMEKLLHHQFDEPTPIESHRRDLMSGLGEVLRKMMAKKPEDRYQTPVEVANALQPYCRPAALPLAVPVDGVAAVPLASPVTSVSDRTPINPSRRRAGAARRGASPMLVAGIVGAVLFTVAALLALGYALMAGAASQAQPTSKDRRNESTRPPGGLATRAQQSQGGAEQPPPKRLRDIAEKLKELNDGFDGRLVPEIEGDTVIGLSLSADQITDLSPLRELSGLRRLSCCGGEPFRGKLTDLAPLRELPLESLDVSNTRVVELWPLRDTPLTSLTASGTLVSDLSPLRGLKLTSLDVAQSPVRDVAPLRGMPLRRLSVSGTGVRDLGPVKDARLEELECAQTSVADLAPLRGHSLRRVNVVKSPVRDLAPLRESPLEELHYDFNLWRDAEVLGGLRSLRTVNGRDAGEFRKDADARLEGFAAWATGVAKMPREARVRAVADRLKELNRGFDGSVTPRFEGDAVTELTFSSDSVADLAPIRAFPGLKALHAVGSQPGRGKLADLAPLRGLRLERIDVSNNFGVRDLTPLVGMRLTRLAANATGISDLSPLAGMPLVHLQLNQTAVADLTPLRGMRLETLRCSSNLVSDLSPLAGMPLQRFVCPSPRLADLSPLRDAPLIQLDVVLHPWRDAELLDALPTLESVNSRPAAEFRKDFEAKRAEFDAWTREVAAMPAEAQAAAVGRRLQERNPGFDGKVSHEASRDGVVELQFSGAAVVDLSPVRALSKLRRLHVVSESRGGKLSDLGPLRGLPLTELKIDRTLVTDLTPLRGMPLGRFSCCGCWVTELGPLERMPLKHLDCAQTGVSDLSPLINASLETLDCSQTQVSDLSALEGMPLRTLRCSQSRVSDLSPLRRCPVQSLHCNLVPERDAEALRAMAKLETVNDRPASEVGKGPKGRREP